MCTTCGCEDPTGARVSVVGAQGHGGPDGHDGHEPAHRHPHPHPDAASEPARHPRTIEIERNILDRNDALADANRRWLADRRILALNR